MAAWAVTAEEDSAVSQLEQAPGSLWQSLRSPERPRPVACGARRAQRDSSAGPDAFAAGHPPPRACNNAAVSA